MFHLKHSESLAAFARHFSAADNSSFCYLEAASIFIQRQSLRQLHTPIPLFTCYRYSPSYSPFAFPFLLGLCLSIFSKIRNIVDNRSTTRLISFFLQIRKKICVFDSCDLKFWLIEFEKCSHPSVHLLT